MSAGGVAAGGLAAALVVLVGGPRPPLGRSSRSSRRDRNRPAIGRRRRRAPDVTGELGIVPAAVVAIPASVVLVGVGATAVALVALVAGAIVVRRRRHQAAAAERARAIPELVELFQLAASAGHPVPAALEAVGARAPPPVHAPLDLAVGSLRRGMAVDEVLVALATELGDPGLALVDALRRSAATGASLPVLLTDVAATARDRRLRDAQAAARRLPVTLLLPLAACTLPAAILLAVVPVIAVSLEALHL